MAGDQSHHRRGSWSFLGLLLDEVSISRTRFIRVPRRGCHSVRLWEGAPRPPRHSYEQGGAVITPDFAPLPVPVERELRRAGIAASPTTGRHRRSQTVARGRSLTVRTIC